MVHKFVKKIVRRKPRVGLALGSGGAAGFAHIGVIKVLVKNKIPIDYIAGSSAGAIVGAYYALNKEIDSLDKLMKDMKKRQMLSLFGLNKLSLSLISDRKLKRFLTDILSGKQFSDLKIPLAITAVDLENSEEVIFRKGSLIDAIMASISIPGLFPIKRINNRIMVDGGILNPTPIHVVKDMKPDIVIAVDLSYPDKTKLTSFNPISIFLRTISIFMGQSMKLRNADLKNTVVIKPQFPEKIHTINIFRAKEYIEIGEKAAREKLPEIKKLINKKYK